MFSLRLKASNVIFFFILNSKIQTFEKSPCQNMVAMATSDLINVDMSHQIVSK